MITTDNIGIEGVLPTFLEDATDGYSIQRCAIHTLLSM